MLRPQPHGFESIITAEPLEELVFDAVDIIDSREEVMIAAIDLTRLHIN